MAVRTKSVYGKTEPADGFRLLVMRRWPRGVRKDSVDEWDKELGAPDDLIDDWKAGGIEWPEFRKRYRSAMKDQRDRIGELAVRAGDETVTLLCGCKDEVRCHRSLLKELIESSSKHGG
jgi:uncharacterized protein YeaO (DUF488 family)